MSFFASHTAIFFARLSEPTDVRVSVDFETVPGTMLPGVDYEHTVGTVVFEPGDVEKSILIPTYVENTRPEGQALAFSVRLSEPVRCAIGDGVGTASLDGLTEKGSPEVLFFDDLVNGPVVDGRVPMIGIEWRGGFQGGEGIYMTGLPVIFDEKMRLGTLVPDAYSSSDGAVANYEPPRDVLLFRAMVSDYKHHQGEIGSLHIQFGQGTGGGGA